MKWGLVIRYLMKISGYSRQQFTRLIVQCRKTGRRQRRQRTVSSFKPRYTEKDVLPLAAIDERHDAPCGQAVKMPSERVCEVFGQVQGGAR